jgi:hypothetical protein
VDAGQFAEQRLADPMRVLDQRAREEVEHGNGRLGGSNRTAFTPRGVAVVKLIPSALRANWCSFRSSSPP